MHKYILQDGVSHGHLRLDCWRAPWSPSTHCPDRDMYPEKAHNNLTRCRYGYGGRTISRGGILASTFDGKSFNKTYGLFAIQFRV